VVRFPLCVLEKDIQLVATQVKDNLASLLSLRFIAASVQILDLILRKESSCSYVKKLGRFTLCHQRVTGEKQVKIKAINYSRHSA
tara:strand:- start:834 stop:1088 length:255 start_codon:yes stop_codon:yes gene_type:complete